MPVIAVLSQKTLRKSELYVQYKKLCLDQKIRNNHVKHRKPEALISNQARLCNAHLTWHIIDDSLEKLITHFD